MVLTLILFVLGIYEDGICIIFKFMIKETLVASNVKNFHGEYEIMIVCAKHDPFEKGDYPCYFLLKIVNKRELKGCIQYLNSLI